jgi:diguanylate cyclase (GGDEF)-like protein
MKRVKGPAPPRRQTAPLRVWGLVLLLGAVAALLISDVLSTAVRGVPAPSHLAWPWIALTVVAVQRAPVRLHIARQTQSIDLFAVPVLVGAVFTSEPGLVFAAASAALVSGLLRRDPVVRVLFNVANQLAGMALALLVFEAVRSGRSPVSGLGWAALAVAMVTYEVATDGGVLAVVTMASGPPGPGYFRNLGFQLAVVLPLNAALAVVAVTACWVRPWSLLVLAGPGLALAVWYSEAEKLRNRFAGLQSLYGFTIKLTELSERAEVLAVALSETRAIFHCEHVAFWVEQGQGTFRYALDADGHLTRDEAEVPVLERSVISSGEPLLMGRGQSASGDDAAFREAMAAPVTFAENTSAVLVAADRHGSAVTFDASDLELFRALAAHLSTALTSCGRLDRLRHEVAAREHEAFHDSLTGLANRSLFTQVVSTALKRRRPAHLVAVMLMDLDGFKEVNDTLGHATGDAILKEIATRVSSAIGPSRLAARLGGDEFAFVVASARTTEEIVGSATAVLDSVYAPMTVDSMVLSMRASIGVAIAPTHGVDPSSLLKRADVAMYAAKASRQGVSVYDPRTDHYSTRRLVLATELQRAIDMEMLEVWYQPIADIADGRIGGFEALLRWNHETLGRVPPDEFIPVAEQAGLMEPLTEWVLGQALGELRRWQDDGYELTMAVNVSARNLFDSELVERLRTRLLEAGVAPQRLTLEITESSMMVDSDRSERILARIARLGIEIAIDDFGTGYSSLSRLKRLPVQKVKVDRSFVKHMCADPGDEAIVRSTIELARNMGHAVVAEGVEDQETWDRLAALGCDQAQGYLMAPAMASPECRAWLADRQRPTLAPVHRLREVGEGA